MAIFGEGGNLVGKGKVFIKVKPVASRVDAVE